MNRLCRQIILNIDECNLLLIYLFSFKGILIDDAEIILANQECYNGIIHVIDKVLVEPEDDLMSIIRNIQDIR